MRTEAEIRVKLDQVSRDYDSYGAALKMRRDARAGRAPTQAEEINEKASRQMQQDLHIQRETILWVLGERI